MTPLQFLFFLFFFRNSWFIATWSAPVCKYLAKEANNCKKTKKKTNESRLRALQDGAYSWLQHTKCNGQAGVCLAAQLDQIWGDTIEILDRTTSSFLFVFYLVLKNVYIFFFYGRAISYLDIWMYYRQVAYSIFYLFLTFLNYFFSKTFFKIEDKI